MLLGTMKRRLGDYELRRLTFVRLLKSFSFGDDIHRFTLALIRGLSLPAHTPCKVTFPQ
jgi:hypothetical protein